MERPSLSSTQPNQQSPSERGNRVGIRGGRVHQGNFEIVRALAYVNHANMGSYREAINGCLEGKDAVPDITLDWRRHWRRLLKLTALLTFGERFRPLLN
jgi:hypothetical protein